MLSIEEFKKIDLRVGQVVGAETIPNTDRLLKVTVDLGNERRTLVGGVARSYSPKDLVGVQVIVMTNLAPATIKGIVSEGMMLGVGCEEPGAVSLVTVDRPVRNGTPVQ
jgi:methionine--tRNA ligase beta chain